MPCEFITLKEMLPGLEFEFMGFRCYWSGWKQLPEQSGIVGQWIAVDAKNSNGYFCALPGKIFGEINIGQSFPFGTWVDNNSFKLISDRAYRKQLIRQGRRIFKKMIDEAERKKVLTALIDDEVEKYKASWTLYRKSFTG